MIKKRKKNKEIEKKGGFALIFSFDWRKYGIIFAIIAAVVLIVYSNALHTPFYYDDMPIIANNSNIHASEFSFSDIVLKPLRGVARFRSIPMISFAVNFHFGRFDTYGYHIVNIILHILNAFLLFGVIYSTLIANALSSSDDKKGKSHQTYLFTAFSAALLWSLSPLATNSVTYIVQRMNLMAMFFSLISILFYLKGRNILQNETTDDVKGEGGHGIGFICTLFFTASFISAVFAVFSKENAVVLPFLIFMYEFFFFRNSRDKSRESHFFKPSMLILYLFIFSMAVVGLSYLWFGKNPLDIIRYSYITRNFTIWERLMTESRILWHYLSLLLFPLPSRMQFVYDYPLSTSLFSPWTTFTSILGLIALLFGVVKYAAKFRLEIFCILWFFLFSLIESSVVGLELIYEHRTYIPSALIFLLFILLLKRFISNSRLVSIIIALFAIFSAYCTVERNSRWRGPETFWGDNYSKSPGEKRVMLNYANALSDAGKKDMALNLYKKLLKVDPDSALAHYNAGEVLAFKKDFQHAEIHFRKSLELDKHYTAAYLALGAVCQDNGRLTLIHI
jgi:hypothetical protein